MFLITVHNLLETMSYILNVNGVNLLNLNPSIIGDKIVAITPYLNSSSVLLCQSSLVVAKNSQTVSNDMSDKGIKIVQISNYFLKIQLIFLKV